MCSVETSLLDESEIFHNECLISNASVLLWLKVLHGIKVGNVHSPSIGRRTFVSIFVDIHGKQENIRPIKRLKQSNALRVNWVVRRATNSFISFVHL